MLSLNDNLNLSPTWKKHNNLNLSHRGRDTTTSNLSPAGGETQRGGTAHQHPTPRTFHTPL